MPTSLSNHVDNLSEINKEECKACMNWENIKSECNFIGQKNNNLHFKCKECERIWLKPLLSCIVNSISEINQKRMQSMHGKKKY